jgi:prepilin-type N-terminal cleavage/methylation domain-containing protein
MQSRTGFTLIESLLAILVLGLFVSVITRLEVNTLSVLTRRRERIDRIFLIKKDLYEFFLRFSSLVEPFSLASEQKGTNNIDKVVIDKVQQPNVKISVAASEISSKSSLSDFKDFIRIVSAEGDWTEGEKSHRGEARKLNMISFVLAPSKEKK